MIHQYVSEMDSEVSSQQEVAFPSIDHMAALGRSIAAGLLDCT